MKVLKFKKNYFEFELNFKVKTFFYLVCYSSVLVGFFLNENSLNGAQHDFEYHLKLISNENFSLKLFTENARNSPVFYYLVFIILKFITIEKLRLLNSLTSIIFSFIFFKSLCVKYKNINQKYLFFFSLIFFFSPTIRSLAIWPYPLQFALIFFITSVYFFEKSKKNYNKEKTIFAYANIFFLALSAYIYPTFAVFSIFYFYDFCKRYSFSNIIKIFFLNVILSLPALYFIYIVGFHFFNVPGVNIDIKDNFNFANKIILISTIIVFFLIPFLELSKIKNIFKIYKLSILIILFFGILLIFFFNYEFTNYYGGGFFFKLSNYIFQNNILFFFIFLFGLFLLLSFFSINFSNFLLFACLILYNLQYTIYMKYYDPLIFIVIIFLMKPRYEIDIKKFIFKTYFFYLVFLLISNVKLILIKNLI